MPAGRSRVAPRIAGEFELIRRLRRRFGQTRSTVVRGIGEDTAVVKTSRRTWLLLTTDLLAEGIHFDLSTATFEDIGYRAAIANLSDIASMGGAPEHLLVALAIPPSIDSGAIAQLYDGLMKACRPHRVTLVGGDTSTSRRDLFISLTLTGSVKPSQVLTRDKARMGDLLYVTGSLGDSKAGLHLLMERNKHRRSASDRTLRDSHKTFLIRRHLRPSARIAEGQFLASRRLASTAIDLSDGLSGDLRHVCEESHVGAELNLATIPVSPACRAYAEARHVNPIQLALSGGEDYELLFTVPPKKQQALTRLARQAGFRFTCVGAITPWRCGIRVTTPDGSSRPLVITSYEHFRNRPTSRGL